MLVSRSSENDRSPKEWESYCSSPLGRNRLRILLDPSDLSLLKALKTSERYWVIQLKEGKSGIAPAPFTTDGKGFVPGTDETGHIIYVSGTGQTIAIEDIEVINYA